MTVVKFSTPAFARRNPDMIAWRVSAIHRCCLHLGMSKEWAIEKLREISPEGRRDHMADLWFTNIKSVRDYIEDQKVKQEEPSDEMSMAA